MFEGDLGSHPENGVMTTKVTELVKRVAEQKRRKNANVAAIAAAREKIRERRQFVPKKIKPSVRISY